MIPLFPSPLLPTCVACRRLRPDPNAGWSCPAFPEGIPAPLLEGRVDHDRPYPGDRGLRFEPDRGAHEALLAMAWEVR